VRHDPAAIPIVAGRLCLDFINTFDSRDSQEPRERFAAYPDLLTWSRRVWILGSGDERNLFVEHRLRPDAAAGVLERAIRIREALHRLIFALIDSLEPTAVDLEEVNDWITDGASRRRLVATPRGLRWRWAAKPAELDRMLWPVAQSAAELLASDDLRRTRSCGECDRLFLDTSKNRSRRWCRKRCGDRVKARRYYRRLQETPG
jgi:predicted RNA-binding Zn ribbon-like protein